jgi:hypothetical protein
VVQAGGEVVRAAATPGGAGDALLYQDALTVSGAGRTVVLPLRVLSAAWRMGFLGPETDLPAERQVVAVSASGGWARLAAAYGSAYHRVAPSLGLLPS